MISLRAQLAKIGHPPSEHIIYSKFFMAPRSLREAMRSMDFPSAYSEVISGDEWDASWTEEIQGVAYHNKRWFFTQNSPKRLWVLEDGSMKKLKAWSLENLPKPVDDRLSDFHIHHFGPVLVEDGLIYIDHWYPGHGQILVMQGDENHMNFVRWIVLDDVPDVGGRVGMVAINAALQVIVTCGGSLNIDRVCKHNFDGIYLDKVELKPQPTDVTYVQGGFWSPNNHLYISFGRGELGMAPKGHQYIRCYSPLNGQWIGEVAARTAEGKQELEGCCYAPIIRGGKTVQIHAVLLENEITKDDVYLKSFSADQPDLI